VVDNCYCCEIAAYYAVVIMARKDRIVNVGIEIELPDLHVAFAVVYNVHGVDVGSAEHAVAYYTVVDLTSDCLSDG